MRRVSRRASRVTPLRRRTKVQGRRMMKPIPKESEQSLSRSLLLQLPATITAIAALGALVYTARSVEASREQLDLLRQGQVSERFSKSIEELGSTSVDMRVGAL